MPSPLRLDQVSVAVLSCNRREELRKTLRGLLAQGEIWREVIVADNASEDGSAAMVRAEFPAVQVIETGGNLGVAGLNRALRAATGRWVLSLDDDSCPDLKTWAPLAEALDGESPFAAITCSVRAQPVDAIHAPVGETLEPYLGFHQAGGLLHRDLIEQLGGFDESLFLWGVELHLAAQATLAGFRLARCDSATVVHRATPLNRSSQRHAFHYCRNHFLLLLRHAPSDERQQLVQGFLTHTMLFSCLHRTLTYVQAIREAVRFHRASRQSHEMLTTGQFQQLGPDLRAAFSFLG